MKTLLFLFSLLLAFLPSFAATPEQDDNYRGKVVGISIGAPESYITQTGKEVTEKADGKPLLTKGIASSVQNLPAQENISAPIIITKPTGLEKIARWLAWASPLLILIGIGAIYFEFKTPGLGIGTVIAILAFSLFFFSNSIAGNLAGYETVTLFLVGLILICVEVFVYPGILIFGVLGVICLLSGLFGGMIDPLSWQKLFSDGGFTLANLTEFTIRPLFNLTLGLAGGVTLVAVLMKYLPESILLKGVTNADTSGGPSQIPPQTATSRPQPGAIGKTVTELRPSGKADFDGNHYEVVSRSGFLKTGETVRVIKIDSFNMVVEPTGEDAPSEESEEKG